MDRVQSLPILAQYYEQTHLLSLYRGGKNAGRGPDFIHEEVNKLVKSFLPPGSIGETTWTCVCRKADKLSAIKKNATDTAGMSISSSTKRPKRHDMEVTIVKREIRTSGVFQYSSPTDMQSITHQPLDYHQPLD